MRVLAALVVFAGVGSGIGLLASSTSAASHPRQAAVSHRQTGRSERDLYAIGSLTYGHHLLLKADGSRERSAIVDPNAIPAVATPEVPSALLIPAMAAVLLGVALVNERRRARLATLRRIEP